METNAAPLEKLIEQFSKLPGIGRKGATRLAYQVLAMDKSEALAFAQAITDAAFLEICEFNKKAVLNLYNFLTVNIRYPLWRKRSAHS